VRRLLYRARVFSHSQTDTNAIIFVVDSADTERLSTACEELHQMLQEEELRDAALLIFANKQVTNV
jgi:GTPase SAR1 family protein